MFGLGVSLGSLLMTNALNEAEFLTAAAMLWHPTDLKLTAMHMEKTYGGFYNRAMGDIAIK